MSKVVNLDALIPREDFLAKDGPGIGESDKRTATKTDLLNGESFRSSLRKPDFQRETASWTPDQVRAFVKAFIEGDLIPAAICWQSESRLSFVIDGAHRLSAIIAWLLDDYGDGAESIRFYKNQIPEEQRRIAQRTRELISKDVGSYEELMAETQNPGSRPHLSERARALAHSGVPLQWIRSSDAQKAERAFFMINQSAVRIDPTELTILNARFKPNAVASRAIVRNATGFKYWKDFSANTQHEIETLGRSIYALLYSPPLREPVRTLELPIAGHGYGSQTLPLIFYFVNIANGLPVSDPSKEKKHLVVKRELPDEGETLKLIQNADRLARRITGTHPSSLGLMPAVYFYSASARHQPTAVLAIAALMMELESTNDFAGFSDVRAPFENFLLTHKYFINQITVKYGSLAKGFRQLKEYYAFVLARLKTGIRDTEIEALLSADDTWQFLSIEKPQLTKKAKKFSTNATQFAYLKEALDASVECSICGARKDNKSLQADHLEDKRHGGVGSADNLQFVHPYCNSTYKDIVARART